MTRGFREMKMLIDIARFVRQVIVEGVYIIQKYTILRMRSFSRLAHVCLDGRSLTCALRVFFVAL